MSRLVPDEPLPSDAFVPGRSPRPARAEIESVEEPPREENWRRCRRYLVGIDLFNHGFYWEAHEAWESLWIAAGRRGRTADFLKGLIKLAAAAVKVRQGNAAGARRHALRARELFDLAAVAHGSADSRLGLSFEHLRGAADALAGPLADSANAPDPTWPLPLSLDVTL
jgi:hypothetical protein